MFSLELTMGQFAEFCANIIFFPLLLCIHSTCVGLQAPNLKEKLAKVSKYALVAEVKTLHCYQTLHVFYLKILIRSNLRVPWHVFNKICIQPIPCFII